MKNLLLITTLIFALALQSVQAQTGVKKLISGSSHAAGLDTASGTGVVTQKIKIIGKYNLTFMTAVTKLTGAPVGVVKLYGSIDDVKYDYVDTPDSLSVTNKAGAQIKKWKVKPSDFLYYKAVYTPTGTQTSTISTSVLVQ